MIDEPLENSSDGEGDTVNDVDNENFNLYVDHNFDPDIFVSESEYHHFFTVIVRPTNII